MNLSKYFLIFICGALLLVLFFSFYNIFIVNDYIVVKQADCDSSIDSCFVSDCESNDSSCDSETTYKKIEVQSKYAGSDYDSLECAQDNEKCRTITCSDDTLEVGEKCVNK
jgi:hypothetical protein